MQKSLAAAFPEKSLAELRHTEREFYHWFCDYIVEIIKHASMSVDDINRHITLEGVERVEKEFRESGKALCVLYLGHFNNWEWVSLLGAKFGPDIFRSQVYHPLHNAVLDRIFSKIVYDKLSAAQQEAITKAAQDAAAFHTETFENDEQALIEKFEQEGMTITTPDKVPFREACAPMYDEYVAKYGDAAVKAIEEARQ